MPGFHPELAFALDPLEGVDCPKRFDNPVFSKFLILEISWRVPSAENLLIIFAPRESIFKARKFAV